MKVRKQPPRILLSCVSAKIGLYDAVVRDARRFDPDAVVIGADCNASCPAVGLIPHFSHVPPWPDLSDAELLEELEKIGVTHVLPTSDEELLFWADRKKFLLNNGITPWVSEPDYIRSCEDKFDFHAKWLEAKVSPIPTTLDANDPSHDRWVVKERNGSGSRKIGLNLNTEDAQRWADGLNEPVFQPYLKGRELTAETWIDDAGRFHGVVLRWRKLIVNGESHETIVFHNSEWEELLGETFSHVPGGQGHCLAQAIVDHNKLIHLVEINPRLGGASALSLHAGLHSIEWNLRAQSAGNMKVPIKPDFANDVKLSKIGNRQIIEG